MDRCYTVLPDGTIFWLDCPEDYVEAQSIIHDEAGDIISDSNWQGSVHAVFAND